MVRSGSFPRTSDNASGVRLMVKKPAIMLTSILIGGKGLDLARQRQERREARA